MKPANILIGPGNRVVLTDFGIAWAADSPAVTTAGVLLGSPSYIAPERARGGHSGAPASASRPYASCNDNPNPKSHHAHGHSKSSKGQGDNSQDYRR